MKFPKPALVEGALSRLCRLGKLSRDDREVFPYELHLIAIQSKYLILDSRVMPSAAARIVSVADAFDAMTSIRPYRKGMSIEQALCRLEDAAGSQFDADLAHIVDHTAEDIPAVTCPHCGPVLAIPRSTRDGNIVYCRACRSKLELHQSGNTFVAEMTGITDNPRDLEPRVNEDVVNDILSQIG